MSWLIMDKRENSTDGDLAGYEMDLHNNYLGRTEKYKHFRAHWFWDRYNWKKWERHENLYVCGKRSMPSAQRRHVHVISGPS